MRLIFLTFITVIIFLAIPLDSKTKKESIQRTPSGIFDLQKNTISNIEFYSTNFGLFAFNAKDNKGGLYWPRGSENQYMFSSGYWFGAKKFHNDSLTTLVELSFNPQTGGSWMVPGRITDSDTVGNSDEKIYRVYFSTDFDSDGTPLINEDGPNWPLWDTNNKLIDKKGIDIFGTYISNPSDRSLDVLDSGPVYISDEDIFSTYKDTDLSFYNGEVERNERLGYPLGLQYEESILSWDSEALEDMIIKFVRMINTSKDTLHDCWFAGAFDPDIAIKTWAQGGAFNDWSYYYDKDKSLNLIYSWTDTDQKELGKGFGYLGVSLLLTPSTDINGNIRKDKKIYHESEQLGLVSFSKWNLGTQDTSEFYRYNLLSRKTISNDTVAGDKRFILSSGPFNMLPGDTACFAYQINLAFPSINQEANGSFEDLENLVENVKKGKEFFYRDIINDIINHSIKKKAKNNLVSPNPFSQSTTINYQLPTPNHVVLKVYDELGIEVAIPVNEFQDAGKHQALFDGDSLVPGMYYYVLQVGGLVQSGMLVLVR